MTRPVSRCGRGTKPRRHKQSGATCYSKIGKECLLWHPCPYCLNARSEAIEHVGRDFPSLGAAVHFAFTENA